MVGLSLWIPGPTLTGRAGMTRESFRALLMVLAIASQGFELAREHIDLRFQPL